jgi:hypothetical protein
MALHPHREHSLASVRCIFVYVYFPHLLGGFLHILTCTCNYMLWPLALREYNLSIPNMVLEPRDLSSSPGFHNLL